MTCQACCREFKQERRRKYCPHCGFNNGRGWWPREEDAAEARQQQRWKRRPRTERATKTQAA